MVRRIALAAAALAAFGFAGSAGAAEPEIMGLRLGMSLPAGEIDAAYETALADKVEDSVGLTVPYDHVETRLADGGRLSLHFSSPADGARLFWIRHTRSWRWPSVQTGPDFAELTAGLEARFGPVARSVGPMDGTVSVALIFAEDGGSADLPETIDLPAEEAAGVQFLSFQRRVALLGAEFSGAVVTIVVDRDGVAAVVEELVDHRRGATVLNPG